MGFQVNPSGEYRWNENDSINFIFGKILSRCIFPLKIRRNHLIIGKVYAGQDSV